MRLWVPWLTILATVIFMIGLIFTGMGICSLLAFTPPVILTFFYSIIPKSSEGVWLWKSLLGFGILSIAQGIFLFFVGIGPFRKIEKWAWLAVFISVMIWFTLGASMSIMFLIYIDMIVYSIILILTLLPLLFTQKAFIIRRDLV